ncbi:peptide chain release factor 1 [bacterium]|nr:peptide chain release factor 1 [bacterium]
MEKIIFDKLQAMEEECNRLTGLLSQPEVVADRVKCSDARYARYARRCGQLREAVNKFQDYKGVLEQMEESKSILRDQGGGDEELRGLAQSELKELEKRKVELEGELKSLLRPERQDDERPVIVEIRAGAGGEEASLFAGDLFRLYCKYAEGKGWKAEVMDSHPAGRGGFKEIIFGVGGKGAYHRLKYEGGVHRVQRVPVTESQGRIHTSTVTVAVLPEAKEIEVKIDPEELRVDTFRSSGPGGQHVNVTDSAVRITHLPTGIVVQCQDEKSQHKNRAKAMRVLRARLLRYLKEKEEERISDDRRAQVGRAKRSEKIRTYNFSQGRVTDHRIGLTLHKLDQVLKGNLDELINALAQKLEAD